MCFNCLMSIVEANVSSQYIYTHITALVFKDLSNHLYFILWSDEHPTLPPKQTFLFQFVFQGKGDPQCRFHFHLSDGMFMKFEAVHNANRFISIHRKYGGNEDVRTIRIRSAMSSGDRGTQGQFKVILVVSDSCTMYIHKSEGAIVTQESPE